MLVKRGKTPGHSPGPLTSRGSLIHFFSHRGKQSQKVPWQLGGRTQSFRTTLDTKGVVGTRTAVEVLELFHILLAHVHPLPYPEVSESAGILCIKRVASRLHMNGVHAILGEGHRTIVHNGHDVVGMADISLGICCELVLHTILDVAPKNRYIVVPIWSRLFMCHAQGVQHLVGGSSAVVAARSLQIQLLVRPKTEPWTARASESFHFCGDIFESPTCQGEFEKKGSEKP